MSLPKLVSLKGAPFRVLPPGIHSCSIEEIQEKFAFNPVRRRLFSGFQRAVSALTFAGCSSIYLDGGFVSNSPSPKDFDGCWDPAGIDFGKLDPVFLDYDDDRAAQKKKYGGEMFIATIVEAASGKTFLDFFQVERHTGLQKGIVLVRAEPIQVAP